jgi:twitching motility protein PilT
MGNGYRGGRRLPIDRTTRSDRTTMDTGSPIIPEFNSWLEELVKTDGSDLHVKVGSPPMLRLSHGLVRLERDPLSPIETQAIADGVVPEDRKALFKERGEVDFAYSVANVGRFRANVFKQRGSVSMVMRKLRFGGPSFEEIGLPDAVRTLADEHRGLILVTGPTGSGKTTTLAAMIGYLNETKPVHIVTIEDPIEVLHKDAVASINQREVGNDTADFLSALRAALRQDPDVILIGEMRDTETVRAALQAAETGHLVLSTLHTQDATETVNRVIDFFPPHQQKQIRLTLAGTLRGIICQRLVPTVDGGRVPALEILVNTGRVAERIIDEEKTSEIKDVVAEGGYYGMITFDQWLLKLIQQGQVTVDDAMQAVSSKHDFELAMQQAGISPSHRAPTPPPAPGAPQAADAGVPAPTADADAYPEPVPAGG